MESNFFDAVKRRRTRYALSKDPVISEECIREIVSEAVKHSPSAFNSQSARVVVLFGEQHDRLWDIVKAELKKIMPPEGFGATEEKINGAFRSGYGTVMFFEDQSVVEGLQKQFPLYKDAFPVFSLNSAGMLQFVVWTALAQEGIGASLQHYNPVIDEAVRAAWDLPASWKLSAQMPFGKPIAEPGEKTFQPLESRVKVFK